MQWLRLDKNDNLLSLRDARDHLRRMPRKQPLNLIAIFGSARQGKSFLMNHLAGPRGCGFAVSNRQAPCTVGVDLAENTVSLGEFKAVDSGIDQFRGRGASSSGIQVGFVDAEGQGDRDTAYDARIACPVLLAAKSCIFNWRDSLQKDKILEQLGIMCRAAQSVDLSEGGKMTSRGEKPFGHLNIVFRDWNYDGDRNSVASQLLDIERAAGSVDAERRNEVRRALSASFESISVWLLPAPVERTADLRRVLKPNMLSQEFRSAAGNLRAAISQQLTTPRIFGGQTVTGPVLARVVPIIAEALNDGNLVLPCSAYESMLRMELQLIRTEFDNAVEESVRASINELHGGSWTLEQAEAFEATIRRNCREMYSGFGEKAAETTTDQRLINEQLELLQKRIDTVCANAIQDMTRALVDLVRRSARSSIAEKVKTIEAELPMAVEGIDAQLKRCLESEIGRLRSLDAKYSINRNGELSELERTLRDSVTVEFSRLCDRNKALEQERLEKVEAMCKTAQVALLQRITDECKASSPMPVIARSRLQELQDMIMQQLDEKLRQECGVVNEEYINLSQGDLSSDAITHYECLVSEAGNALIASMEGQVASLLDSLKAQMRSEWLQAALDLSVELPTIMGKLNSRAKELEVSMRRGASEFDAWTQTSMVNDALKSIQQGFDVKLSQLLSQIQAKRDESIEAQNLLRERELKLQIEEQRQRQAQEQQLIEEAERAKELKVMERERKKQEERTRKELAKQDAVRAKAQQLAEKKAKEKAEREAKKKAKEHAEKVARLEAEAQRAKEEADELERARLKRQREAEDEPEEEEEDEEDVEMEEVEVKPKKSRAAKSKPKKKSPAKKKSRVSLSVEEAKELKRKEREEYLKQKYGKGKSGKK